MNAPHATSSLTGSDDRSVHGFVRELLAQVRRRCHDGLGPLEVELQLLDSRLSGLKARELSNVDHAARLLRDPMRVLLGRLGGKKRLSRVEIRNLGDIALSINCILDHVDSVHAAGRLSADQLVLHYVRVDLAARVRAICCAFEPLALARDLTFQVSVPKSLVVEVDAAKLEVVALNLLFRAFKHTPVGGEIRCVLGENTAQDEAFLEVLGGARAVDGTRAKHLFDRSRQFEHSAFLEVAGLNVGLGIARDLMTLQGGTLTLEQDEGASDALCARFPIRAASGTPIETGGVAAGDLSLEVAAMATRELQIEATLETRAINRDGRPLVLLVEASRCVQRILLEGLEPEYATVSALTAADGLQKAAALRPDLMIVDAALPGVDSLLGAQRRCVELAQPSILVLTDSQDPHEAARMLEGCADDAVQKPFLTTEVKARARNLVRAKRTRDMLGHMVGERDGDLIEQARNGARQLHDWDWAVKEVQAARRAAENASRIKSNFLRIMSHELKTPITAMQLQMRVLQQDPEVTLSTKLDEGFERIWRSSRRLLHLVDTVLEWARVEGGRCELTMELFDLAALVSEVIGELLPHAAQKGIALELHAAEGGAQLVTGDRRLVYLVVVNMLTRAVQVTSLGGIEITVGRAGGLHSVSVKDGGSPIPTEQRSEVFDPLLSSDGLHYRSGNGSGLGLHVVRDIARAFDGEVVLQPMDGPGNTFVLKLPALPPERSTARLWTGGLLVEPAHAAHAADVG